jgi:predicted nicotinamide N-methyase
MINQDKKALGDTLYRNGRLEEAVDAYSAAKQTAAVALNRAQCYIRLRLYNEAIEDCSRVLELRAAADDGTLRIKALLRRASCYEQTGELAKGLRDIEATGLLNASVTPSSLKDTAKALNTRLLSLQRLDTAALQREGAADGRLISKAQTLRLNFAKSPPTRVSPEGIITFHLCTGNEFGLWDRALGSAVPLGWELVPPVPGWTLHPSSHQEEVLLGADGKCSVYLRLEGCGGEEERNAVVVVKLSLVSPLPSGATVQPVFSLPLSLPPAENEREKKKEKESEAACPIVSCVRCIELEGSSAGRRVFAYEAAGDLGIGGKVWDSSFVLMRYLEEHRDSLLQGKRVVELGAGTGIVGIGATLVGCSCASMTITDYDSVCRLISENIRLNLLLAPDATAAASLKRCRAVALDWGEQALPALLGGVDVVIASDVVYDPLGYMPLAHTLAQLLRSTDSSVCILAHRSRHPEENTFFAALPGLGLAIEELQAQDRPSTSPSGQLSDVKIFKIVARSL